MALRPASLRDFQPARDGMATVRGHNFSVHRLAGSADTPRRLDSSAEILLIFAQCSGEIRIGTEVHAIPARSLAIAPPGECQVRVDGPGSAFALTTGTRRPAVGSALNATDYAVPDARVKAVPGSGPGVAAARTGLRIHRIDAMPFPPGNPRLKFLQTATMSVNWVEYQGARQRGQLSPHAHTDFEQGSLAIAGQFVHHLRTPWGPDADQWRDDQHLAAAADTLLIVPPEIIHTTEGVGDEHHILIDIFAPPRGDFIAKGWVHNAADYAP